VGEKKSIPLCREEEEVAEVSRKPGEDTDTSVGAWSLPLLLALLPDAAAIGEHSTPSFPPIIFIIELDILTV
jgi:hypothetical protein